MTAWDARTGRPTVRGEGYWTRRVIALATELGLLAHWLPDSRRAEGSKGFPDIVTAGPNGVLFAELKMSGGETTAAQDAWAWTLREAAGKAPYYLTYRLWVVPFALANGTIERELRKLL